MSKEIEDAIIHSSTHCIYQINDLKRSFNFLIPQRISIFDNNNVKSLRIY